MLSYSEILDKIKHAEVNFRDGEGNNLLHLLMQMEEMKNVPFEVVRSLLKRAPYLINLTNSNGLYPTDTLDTYQLHSKSSNRPMRRILFQYIEPGLRKENFYKSIHMSFVEQYQFQNEEGIDYKVLSHPDPKTIFLKPTLLCFSGIGGFMLPFLMGVSRNLTKSLGFYGQHLKNMLIMSVRYPGNDWDFKCDYEASHQVPVRTSGKPDHPLLYIQSFVAEYLRPLYTDEKGKRIETRKAQKNVRQLNFLAYSYGANVIKMLSDMMVKDMRAYSYSDTEIKSIQSQIPAIMIGPDIQEGHYSHNFRTYHILSTEDEVVFQRVEPTLAKLPNSQQDFIKTHLKEEPHQKVLLLNDLSHNRERSPHHINTYLALANDAYTIANLWKNFIIFNALNNSIQNKNTTLFLPLARSLEKIPSELLFMNCQSILRKFEKLAIKTKYLSKIR